MQTNIQTFTSEKFGELRTQQGQEGKVWFCLNDVTNALGLTNVTELRKRLKEDGFSTTEVIDTIGRRQQMLFVDEPNLYRCIFQSRKKEAERFQDWVFEEVLPSIRQSGGYVATAETDSPEVIMARALRVAQATIERHAQRAQILEGKVEEQDREIRQLAPKAEYADLVLQSLDDYTFTQIAKDLGMRSVHILTDKLRKYGIIYRQSGQWLPTAKWASKGYFTTRTAVFVKRHPNGQPKLDEYGRPKTGTRLQTTITEYGRQWLHGLLSGRSVGLDGEEIMSVPSAAYIGG